eukprot:8776411-Pyramimonas_sp.AAC.2
MHTAAAYESMHTAAPSTACTVQSPACFRGGMRSVIPPNKQTTPGPIMERWYVESDQPLPRFDDCGRVMGTNEKCMYRWVLQV